MNKTRHVECSNDGQCFGMGVNGFCVVLSTPYEKGKCPFQKRERFVTNGKIYPYNTHYGRLEEDD
jgi:hypothetical protein